jgi:ribulose bisphosphate carboxylase small subunit
MLQLQKYSLQDIQDEVRALVSKGFVNQQQHIYDLVKHFSYREWQTIEQLLESHDYLLRDHVIDLVGRETWQND